MLAKAETWTRCNTGLRRRICRCLCVLYLIEMKVAGQQIDLPLHLYREQL